MKLTRNASMIRETTWPTMQHCFPSERRVLAKEPETVVTSYTECQRNGNRGLNCRLRGARRQTHGIKRKIVGARTMQMCIPSRIRVPRYGLLARICTHLNPEPSPTPELDHIQPSNNPRRLLKRFVESHNPGICVHPTRPSYSSCAEQTSLQTREILFSKRNLTDVRLVEECVGPLIGMHDESMCRDICRTGFETPIVGFAEIQRANPDEDCRRCNWDHHAPLGARTLRRLSASCRCSGLCRRIFGYLPKR